VIDLLLAARNLLRNRRRSFAALFALALGAAAILLFGGYRANIEYTMLTAYVRDGGHLQIQHRDFFLYGSGNPTLYGIADYAALIEAIRADEALRAAVVVATPKLQFGGIASHFDADVSRPVAGLALVPADQRRLREWNEFGVAESAQQFTLEGAPPDGAVIGTGVARVLQLCAPLRVADCPTPQRPPEAPADPGEALAADIAALAARAAPAAPDPAAAAGGPPRIELLAATAGGAPNVVSLQVMKAERQGFKEVDEIFLLMQLAQAQRLVYGRAPPRATAIVVQVQRTAQVAQVAQQLQALIARSAPQQPLAVLDFRQLNPFFVQTVQMFDTIFAFVFALMAIIVLFTVGHAMSTSVTERTVEIGTVRAMGLRRRGVQRLFVIEGALLGAVGALAGVVAAVVIATVVNALGLTWLPPGSGHPLPLQLMLQGQGTLVAGTALGLFAIAVASAWWPAYRASRLVIVDALRHV
jgi:putative ABC transport system permease protein